MQLVYSQEIKKVQNIYMIFIHSLFHSFLLIETLPIFRVEMEIWSYSFNVTKTCNKSWAAPMRQPRVLMIIPNVGEFDMVSGARVRRFDNLQTTIVDY